MDNRKFIKIFSAVFFVASLMIFSVPFKPVSANYDRRGNNDCDKYAWWNKSCNGSRRGSSLCKRVNYPKDCRQRCGNSNNRYYNYDSQYYNGSIRWDWWNRNCPTDSNWYDLYCRYDWWNQQNNKCCIYMYPILYGNNYRNPWPSYNPHGLTYGWWESNCPQDDWWYDRYCQDNEWNMENNDCCIFMGPVLYGNDGYCQDDVEDITYEWWDRNCPQYVSWYDQYCEYNEWNQDNNECCVFLYPKLYGEDSYCSQYYEEMDAYPYYRDVWYNNNNNNRYWID